MARPRVPLGLEASRTSLNLAVCAELGRTAREARTKRGLTVAEAAKALMLSPAQLTALETVTPEAFYGADFYRNALKKYLTYLNLPADLAADALVKPVEPAKQPAPFKRKKSVVPAAAEKPQIKTNRSPALTPTFVAAAVAASAMAGWWMLTPRKPGPAAASTSGHPGSGAPIAEPVVGPDPLPAGLPGPPEEPAAIELDTRSAAASAVSAVSATLSPVIAASELRPVSDVQDDAGRYGAVGVAQSTWVFVRYADNSTDERRIGAGARFVFRAQPVYIAVGEAAGTTIVVNGRAIDATPFTTNGQIRIGKAFLGTPVAGR